MLLTQKKDIIEVEGIKIKKDFVDKVKRNEETSKLQPPLMKYFDIYMKNNKSDLDSLKDIIIDFIKNNTGDTKKLEFIKDILKVEFKEKKQQE